jgi:hypothetical protein
MKDRGISATPPLLPSLCSTEETIPPSRPAVPDAWQRTAVKDGRRPPRQRRVASLRGRSLPRDARCGRGVFVHASQFRFRLPPYTAREAEAGSPSKTALATPSNSVLMLISPTPLLLAGCSHRTTAARSERRHPANLMDNRIAAGCASPPIDRDAALQPRNQLMGDRPQSEFTHHRSCALVLGQHHCTAGTPTTMARSLTQDIL